MSSSISPKRFLIGISGGTASGKSTLSQKISETLNNDQKRKIMIISLDSFYKNLNEKELILAKEGCFNFDHPDSFDFDELYNFLQKVLTNQEAIIYEYDRKLFCRSSEKYTLITADISVIIVEGILAFYNSSIRELFDMNVFVDCDADTRLSRRVIRDTQEEQREITQILKNYFDFVKPAFEEFCLPTKKYADIILPRGADNTVGIDLIIQHIEDLLVNYDQKDFENQQSQQVDIENQNCAITVETKHLSPEVNKNDALIESHGDNRQRNNSIATTNNQLRLKIDNSNATDISSCYNNQQHIITPRKRQISDSQIVLGQTPPIIAVRSPNSRPH